MYDYLDAKRLPETDNCDVYVETIPESIALKNAITSGAAAGGVVSTSFSGTVGLILGASASYGIVVLNWVL
jgi:hypothetical protein